MVCSTTSICVPTFAMRNSYSYFVNCMFANEKSKKMMVNICYCGGCTSRYYYYYCCCSSSSSSSHPFTFSVDIVLVVNFQPSPPLPPPSSSLSTVATTTTTRPVVDEKRSSIIRISDVVVVVVVTTASKLLSPCVAQLPFLFWKWPC